MSEISEDYASDPDENEKPEMPGLRNLSEDAEQYTAEAGAELLSQSNEEPQPLESEEEDSEEEPENEKNVQLEPTWTSEDDIPKETQIGIPQGLMSETLGEMGGKLYKDLKVPVDEKGEEPDLEPPEEAKPDITEGAIETDIQLTMETKSEVPGATASETSLELLLEETEQEAPEESLREEDEELELEPSEQTKPDFASDELKKSIKEVDLQSPKMTQPEIPEATQNESTEEKKTKPGVEEQTQRKSIEEKVPEPLEHAKRTDQKENQIKSKEKTELALPEKSVSEETLRNLAEEKGLEPPEQTKLEFPKMEPRKSTEETSQVPPWMTKPVDEKRKTESTEEKNLDLPVEAKLRERRKSSIKETDKIRNSYAVGSDRGSEVDLPSTHYENPQEFSKRLELDFSEYSNSHFSEPQMELKESFNEKKSVDLSQELEELVPKDESRPPKRTEPQFEFLNWSPEKVAEWISQLGFPQYKECFTANFISGNKLIYVNCSNLPQMGITDFEHMKVISRHVRELLGIEEPLFSRSIRLPYRDNIGLFLEQKSHTGVKSDRLTFSEFVEAAGLQDYAP
ncbi:PREDICTED: sterile alpha motif domain-containing protein 15 isoform X2 [Chinchilla lanigera]|uniref:SAM domain-containing protein n=1 Tax=Chinchilla lanigera TaxID=34839 RepID=A0A8C2VU86_CHILA|nr:PREDICTED: sterile alpha motif domain-containing protein 15 isoform X2 [Chinchilla lanigera]